MMEVPRSSRGREAGTLCHLVGPSAGSHEQLTGGSPFSRPPRCETDGDGWLKAKQKVENGKWKRAKEKHGEWRKGRVEVRMGTGVRVRRQVLLFSSLLQPEPSLGSMHGHRPRRDFPGSNEGNRFGLTQVLQSGFLLVYLTGRPNCPLSGVHRVAPSSQLLDGIERCHVDSKFSNVLDASERAPSNVECQMPIRAVFVPRSSTTRKFQHHTSDRGQFLVNISIN